MEERKEGLSPPDRSPSCTAIIVHPKVPDGILSALVPRLQRERQVMVILPPGIPRVITLRQGDLRAELGLTTWPSGIHLAQHCATHKPPGFWDGKTVLELGAGSAPLASITAAMLGAKAVFITDGAEETLKLAESNFAANLSPSFLDKASFHRLWWGDEADTASLTAAIHAVTPHVDVIVAADVLYEHKAIRPLSSAVNSFCGDTTEVLFAWQSRLHDFERDLFDIHLRSYGILVAPDGMRRLTLESGITIFLCSCRRVAAK